MGQEIGDKRGEDALRGCARAIRLYIHARPGFASATWLSPTTKDKEWNDALESVASIIGKLSVNAAFTMMPFSTPCTACAVSSAATSCTR